MRGSIKKRYEGSWSLILELGYRPDPKTGVMKRRQKWVTFRGNQRQAEKKLAELVNAHNHNELVEPSKLTVGEWLLQWVDLAVKPPKRRASTYATYLRTITNHLVPGLGALRLQQLRALDIERYYADVKGLSERTKAQHHAILSGALKAAVRAGYVVKNVAVLVNRKPSPVANHEQQRLAAWDVDEARTFLATAKAAGHQPAAFYATALDSGCRKNELCGLQWSDLDLDKGTLTVLRQLVKNGPEPVFGPPKNGQPRTIDLGADTVALLKAHKKAQAELKMRNRTAYRDLGMGLRSAVGRSARSGSVAWAPAPFRESWTARVRTAHQGREGSPGHDPRTPTHVRDVAAEGRRPCARRPAQTRARKHRHHAEHLRERVAVDGGGCRAATRGAPPRLTANQKANEPLRTGQHSTPQRGWMKG